MCIERDTELIDILVHSAVNQLGFLGQASLEALDSQYRVNVRAPYALTQALLSNLRAHRDKSSLSTGVLACRRELMWISGDRYSSGHCRIVYEKRSTPMACGFECLSRPNKQPNADCRA